MKDDLRDILSIPNHIMNSEKGAEKEDKNRAKDDSRKSMLVSKEVLSITKGLFPIKVGRMWNGEHGQQRAPEESRWIFAPIKFGEEKASHHPEVMHWVQRKEAHKVFKYTKYDISLTFPQFSSEEYDELLAGLDGNWKKEETMYLWELLQLYELRFFVVHDRWDQEKYPRSIEEIKQRFYTIARELAEARGEKGSPYLSYHYDVNYEKHRKYQLEKYILRGRDRNEEERLLNEEYRKIDLLIKKKEREQKNLQKMMLVSTDNETSEKMQYLIEKIEDDQHTIFSKTDKCVYLRGAIMHGALPSLTKGLNKKIEAVMTKELHIPEKPMPTKYIHGLYDSLRKNILKLFSLQISMKNKEEEKRKMLERVEKLNETRRVAAEAEGLSKRAPEAATNGFEGKSNKKFKQR